MSNHDTAGLPVDEAARQLGVHRRTLQTWIDRGAPVVQRGHRGRGACCTLIDPDAVREWRDQPAAHAAPGLSTIELGFALAWSLDEVFEASGRLHKRDLARELALVWLLFTNEIAERLNETPIPQGEYPPPVQRLIRTAELHGN